MATYANITREAEGYPAAVGRLKTAVTLDPDTGLDDEKEVDITIVGVVTQIHFVVPALDSGTCELLLHDEDNKILFASGELAASTTHVLNMQRAVCGTTTLRIETSATQTAARIHSVVIYYI